MRGFFTWLLMVMMTVGFTYPAEPASNHTNIYIEIDVRFSKNQISLIDEDIGRWNAVLNGKVYIIPIYHQTPPGRWRDKKRPLNHIFMFWVERSAEELGKVKYDATSGVLAEVTVDIIGSGADIIVYHDLSEENFKKVILHELGHLLGAPHSEKFGTLMFPYVWGQVDDIDESLLKTVCLHQGGVVEKKLCK